MWGVVVLHWMLVVTLALGCFVINVMKGPRVDSDRHCPRRRRRD
jgi:hypothetical protein